MPVRILIRLAPLGLVVLAGCAELTEFRSVLEVDGEAVQGADLAPYDLGKAHLAKGRLGLAVTAFNAALAAEPRSVAVLNGLAATYDRMGRYDLADEYYTRALEHAPDDPQTLNNAGYSRWLRGDHREAVRLLAAAGSQAPDDPVIAANLAAARTAVAAAPPTAPAHAEAEAARDEAAVGPRMLVERTGPGVHTLALAAPEFLAAARKVGIDPKLAAVGGDAPARKRPPAEPRAAPKPVAQQPATPQAAAPPTCRLEVSNGVGRARLAGRMRGFLRTAGVDVGCLTNAPAFGSERTVIYHREGFATLAAELAGRLPVPVAIEAAPDQRNDVRILIGRDLLPFDRELVAKETSHEA